MQRIGWPQVIMIVIMGANVGISLAKHGEPHEGNYNFITALIAALLEYWILKAGGFFR
jgi:hypothetical protein